MTQLQSLQMQLSPSERHWLPWLGRTGKLSMGWSCWLNRGVYPAIEQVFEGVAQSRVRILQNWVSAHWDHLADLAASLGEGLAHVDIDLLERSVPSSPTCPNCSSSTRRGGYWRPRAPRMSVSRIWTCRPLRGAARAVLAWPLSRSADRAPGGEHVTLSRRGDADVLSARARRR